MNEEISHIAQWNELTTRALNFGLNVTFDSTAFFLWGNFPKMKELGRFTTLADLRAGISDYIAEERKSGRMTR